VINASLSSGTGQSNGAATPGTLAYFAKTGTLSSGPANATPWDVLKDLGLELVAIIVLAVVAGTGTSGANFALGFLVLLWLLAIIANPAKA
jgi:hypothetical protein